MKSYVDSSHNVIEGHLLSSKGLLQLLDDLVKIRALVSECIASPLACNESLIFQQVRDVSLPLCQLSLARVVEVLNSSAPYVGDHRMEVTDQRLKAYIEVLDDVTCYLESIRDGFKCDDDFLENIEDKIYNTSVFPELHAPPSLDDCSPDVIKGFLANVDASLRNIRVVLVKWQSAPQEKALAMDFLRHLHALKGGVLIYGVEGLINNIQHLESYVAAFLKGEIASCEVLFELFERYLSRLYVIVELLAKQQREGVTSFVGEGGESKLCSDLWKEGVPQHDVGATDQQVVHQSFSQKLPRLHFLVARASMMLGKQVDLMVKGEMVAGSIDVFARLTASLELLLWNAIDHGIESPVQRRAAGKPENGEIVLSLEFNEASSEVVITVADDGVGIDEDAVRQKALKTECMMVADMVAVPPSELIFYPGLSTCASVSQVSGRGMGLDVVKTEVGRLGGVVTVTSVRGRGACFRLVIPV